MARARSSAPAAVRTPILAVVFDLDGTLLRTEHLQWKGWNVALKPFKKHLSKKNYSRYCGHSGHEIEKELISFFGLSSRVRPGAILAAKEKFLHHHFATQPLHWATGARTALRFFKRRGISLALATGGKRKEMMKKLKRLNAHLHFDALVCLNDVKKGKPHPDIYLLACRRLGVRAKDALAFEDTSSGVVAASRAGLRVIAIPTIYSFGQDFSSAAAVCRDFKQALARLKHLRTERR